MSQLLVFNLEFPAHAANFTLGPYVFSRAPDYDNAVLRLNHLVEITYEHHIKPTTGGHVPTGRIALPSSEPAAALAWDLYCLRPNVTP